MLRYWPRHGLAALALASLATAGTTQSLTTTFNNNNSHDGNMFNMIGLVPLTVNSFDVHFDNTLNICGTGCSEVEVEVHRTTNGETYVGNEEIPGVWTLIGSVQHTVTTPNGTAQPLNLPINVALDPNGIARYGMYVSNTGDTNTVTGNLNEFILYTNKSGGGSLNFANADMRIKCGVGLGYPFNIGGNGVFADRIWNGTAYYTLAGGCTSNAVNYCTAGTSASGCTASLLYNGTASATSGSNFNVIMSGGEGAKDGLFFYGQNGRQANSWGNGTSLQCVVTPVKRGGLLTGGGSAGFCDGTFQQDLNARWCPTCTHPNHQPTAGQKMQIQAWYRDPFNTSNQTTSLSDALEVDICP